MFNLKFTQMLKVIIKVIAILPVLKAGINAIIKAYQAQNDDISGLL